MIASIAFIILIVILGSIINKTMKSQKKEKNNIKEELSCYQLDLENNEKMIKEIQNNELRTERFKQIEAFINGYDNREYVKIESELLRLIKEININVEVSLQEYERRKKLNLEYFEKVKTFIDNLSIEQLKNNIILKYAKILLTFSDEECRNILKKVIEECNKLELSSDIKKMKIDYNIENAKDIFPIFIEEKIDKMAYNLDIIDDSDIYILDLNHQHIYSKYNEYVKKIIQLTNGIYNLQMCNILSNYDLSKGHITIKKSSIKANRLDIWLTVKKDYIDQIRIYQISQTDMLESKTKVKMLNK